MVTVCAWCQTYMGSKEPLDDPGITHGICTACMERQTAGRAPVLVVSPERAGTVPLLTTLLRDSPDVAVVVDRRNGERRLGDRGRSENAGWADGERRIDERRRGPSLYLV